MHRKTYRFESTWVILHKSCGIFPTDVSHTRILKMRTQGSQLATSMPVLATGSDLCRADRHILCYEGWLRKPGLRPQKIKASTRKPKRKVRVLLLILSFHCMFSVGCRWYIWQCPPEKAIHHYLCPPLRRSRPRLPRLPKHQLSSKEFLPNHACRFWLSLVYHLKWACWPYWPLYFRWRFSNPARTFQFHFIAYTLLTSFFVGFLLLERPCNQTNGFLLMCLLFLSWFPFLSLYN